MRKWLNRMDTFKYLQKISPDIKNRFKETEKMIMYASPSFYDALGNLIESYFSYVALYYKIRLEIGASHGKMTNALKPLLIEFMGIDERLYNNIKKISSNVNMHKHNDRMGYLDSSSCVWNMNTFFDLYSQITKDSQKAFDETFDYQYYKDIYGIFSMNNIKMIIKSYNELSNDTKTEVKSMQSQIDKYMKIVEKLSSQII